MKKTSRRVQLHMAAACLLSVLCAALAPLVVRADEFSVQDGGQVSGVHNNVRVTNIASGQANLYSEHATLLGGSTSSYQLVVGQGGGLIDTTFTVGSGQELAFGSATSANVGGTLNGQVVLDGGTLDVYGGNSGMAQYDITGALTGGSGTLRIMGRGALSVNAIGDSGAKFGTIIMDGGQILRSRTGVLADELVQNSGSLRVAGAGVTLKSATIHNGADLSASAGDVVIDTVEMTDNSMLRAFAGDIKVGSLRTVGNLPHIFDLPYTVWAEKGNINIGNAKMEGGASVRADVGNITFGDATSTTETTEHLLYRTTVEAGGSVAVNGRLTVREGLASILAGEDVTLGDGNSAGAGELYIRAGRNLIADTVNALRMEVGGSVTANTVRGSQLVAGSMDVTGDVTMQGNQANGEGYGSLSLNAPSRVGGNLALNYVLASSLPALTVGNSVSLAAANADFSSLSVPRLDVADSSAIAGSIIAPAGSVPAVSVRGASQSSLAVASLQPGANISVGPNSQMAIGQKWLAPGRPGSGQAELGLAAPYSAGSLALGSGAPAGMGIYFGPDSWLHVEADIANEKNNPGGALTAFRGPTGAMVANGAMLSVDGAEAGNTYVVIGQNGNIPQVSSNTLYQSAAAWDERRIETGSHLVGLAKIPGRDGSFAAYVKRADEVYPGLDGGIRPNPNPDIPPNQPGVSGSRPPEFGSADHFINHASGGVRYLSRVTSTRYMDHDHAGAVKSLESSARVAVLGAVPQLAFTLNEEAGRAAGARASFSGAAGLQEELYGRSIALWAMPVYKNFAGHGLRSGNFNYALNAGLGGITAGADWTDGSLRVGLDLSVGGGYSESGGDMEDTRNRLGFWGFGAYAGWRPGMFSLWADAQYTETWNSLNQELAPSLEMNDFTGDLTARAFSASLTAALHAKAGPVEISPHAGARYTFTHVDKYTIYSDGAVLDGEDFSQSIWTFPFGVEFGAGFETGSGWRIRPGLDIFAIPAAGDIYAHTRSRFMGTTQSFEVNTQTMDYWRLGGSASLELSRGPFSAGLNYRLESGLRTTAQTLFANFCYQF